MTTKDIITLIRKSKKNFEEIDTILSYLQKNGH